MFVHDVDGSERPAVDLDGFAVLSGGVASALVVSVGLYDVSTGQLFGDEVFDPSSRDDVRAVRFSGVEFDSDFAGDVLSYAGVNLPESF